MKGVEHRSFDVRHHLLCAKELQRLLQNFLWLFLRYEVSTLYTSSRHLHFPFAISFPYTNRIIPFTRDDAVVSPKDPKGFELDFLKIGTGCSIVFEINGRCCSIIFAALKGDRRQSWREEIVRWEKN